MRQKPVQLDRPRSPVLITPPVPENQLSENHPEPQTPIRIYSPAHSSTHSRDTTSSPGSQQDFYTPGPGRTYSRIEETENGMEDSLSPVSLGRNDTLVHSPEEQSTPVISGGRTLRPRETLNQPNWFRPTYSIGSDDIIRRITWV